MKILMETGKYLAVIIIIFFFLFCKEKNKFERKEKQNCSMIKEKDVFQNNKVKISQDSLYLDSFDNKIRRKVIYGKITGMSNISFNDTLSLTFIKKWRNDTLVMERISGKIPLATYDSYFKFVRTNLLPTKMNVDETTQFMKISEGDCQYRFFSNKLQNLGYYETRIELYR